MTYNEAFDAWALGFADPQEACFRLLLAGQEFACTGCGASFRLSDASAVAEEDEIRCLSYVESA